MQKQLPILGRTFKRIDAVDGKKLSQQELNEKTTFFSRMFSTRSIIGCFLSHNKVWQTIVNSGDNYAIIMEDDCELQPNFQEDLTNTLNELNNIDPEWDWIYLGCCGRCKADENYTFMQSFLTIFSNKLSKNKEKIQNSKYNFVPEAPNGLHCYIISNKCAKKLLLLMDKVNHHVDIEFLRIAKENDLNVYASKKQLAYQFTSSSRSTLTESKFPTILNSTLDKITDDYNISYSYYFGVPMIEISGLHINLYLILFIILSLLVPAYYLKSFLIILGSYLFIELILVPNNISIITYWIVILSIILYLKFKLLKISI